jgi:uncharacterized membrane protein
MGPMSDADGQAEGDLFDVKGEGTGRIEAFSDGVFAIAITLLVLDLAVPAGTERDDLASEIWSLHPDYLAFALSFAIIGMHWISHHSLFRRIERFDATLLWINLLVLASVVFIPFPTRILADFGNEPISIALYAGTLSVTGLSSAAVWWYAYRHHLVIDGVSYDDFRLTLRRMLAPTMVFVVTVPLAFVWSNVMLTWFVLIFADRIADAIDARLRKRASTTRR